MYIEPVVIAAVVVLLGAAQTAGALEERQLTFSPKNHDLDNNDNFSPDGRFLCYDTRETVGPGIDHGETIEIVEVATGKETVLYRPLAIMRGERPAPGIGAVSFSGSENKVAFIHGPPVEQVPERGPYGKPNRNGAGVVADPDVKPENGVYPMVWLDRRDIETGRDTLPGAHRGGTHRHEYTLDGKRIGFTYDDFLLPQYGRTIGYMEPHPEAPGPATHFFALLAPVVPAGASKPGELEQALGDSWVGKHGTMRAFIGKIRNDDGETYEESLFVVDIPANVDITTADSGSTSRYPTPPKGTSIRRLTHTWAAGIVRGTADGKRIAYFAKDEEGVSQVFVIPSDGSDRHEDPAKRPVQVTHLPHGAEDGLRWHPSGNSVLCLSNNGIVSTCVKSGPRFGESMFLTPQGDEAPRIALVVSPDGKSLAYNKPVQERSSDGGFLRNYAGEDFRQIFLMDYPDKDGDGVMDGPAN